MGLTLRQLLCSGIAIGLAVLIYLWAKPLLGQETASWLCILAAAPIAAAGFLSYDGFSNLEPKDTAVYKLITTKPGEATAEK